MRPILFACILVSVGSAGCTKPNPDLCCTDAADCARLGVTDPKACGNGLSCRGNQCVFIGCATASECDATAPFCDPGPMSCTASCSTDDQCPGFRGAASDTLCEAGSCVQCRVAADCSGTTPVCGTDHACVACSEHSQCASGVCADDGSCAPESAISYAAPAGSTTSECSRANPCSLPRAVTLTGSRPYVLLADGDYALESTGGGLTLTGIVHIIGNRVSPPKIHDVSKRFVFGVADSANATLDGVWVTDATDNRLFPVQAIGCAPTATLHVKHARFSDNNPAVRTTTGCKADFVDSSFERGGIVMSGSDVIVDRCVFTAASVSLGSGTYAITNSILTHSGTAVTMEARPGARFEFNTVVDNVVGVKCLQDGTAARLLDLSNSIIARNGTATDGYCSTTTSYVSPDVSGLAFTRPGLVPYDYHIGSQSSAIDQATGGMTAYDIDGQSRPSGVSADLGADEFVP